MKKECLEPQESLQSDISELYEELENVELRLMRSIWSLENAIVDLRMGLKDVQIQLERLTTNQKTSSRVEKLAYS